MKSNLLFHTSTRKQSIFAWAQKAILAQCDGKSLLARFQIRWELDDGRAAPKSRVHAGLNRDLLPNRLKGNASPGVTWLGDRIELELLLADPQPI
jgi:hypothetical protein